MSCQLLSQITWTEYGAGARTNAQALGCDAFRCIAFGLDAKDRSAVLQQQLLDLANVIGARRSVFRHARRATIDCSHMPTHRQHIIGRRFDHDGVARYVPIAAIFPALGRQMQFFPFFASKHGDFLPFDFGVAPAVAASEKAAQGGLRGSVLVTVRQTCDGCSSGKPRRIPREGFGAMYVVAHRDVGEEAFRAISVLIDEIGGKPDAGFLFNWVHGYRVRGVDFVQYSARFGRELIQAWTAWANQFLPMSYATMGKANALAHAYKCMAQAIGNEVTVLA